jgi:hypothetical protein
LRDNFEARGVCWELGMRQYAPRTIAAMQAVLDEVGSHISPNSTSARTFIASRILECASNGNETHEGLLEAGRRAVIEQFGALKAIRQSL